MLRGYVNLLINGVATGASAEESLLGLSPYHTFTNAAAADGKP